MKIISSVILPYSALNCESIDQTMYCYDCREGKQNGNTKKTKYLFTSVSLHGAHLHIAVM